MLSRMKKINMLTIFLEIFGINQNFWSTLPSYATNAIQTNQQIFVVFSFLLNPTSLKTPFPSLNPSTYPLVKTVKGLINQTKWLIYQIQHSISTTANHPQEGILWI